MEVNNEQHKEAWKRLLREIDKMDKAHQPLDINNEGDDFLAQAMLYLASARETNRAKPVKVFIKLQDSLVEYHVEVN